MSWDIYGNPLRRGYCEVHPDVHQEYPCSICMAQKQQQIQPHNELEQLQYEFAQQGDYIRHLESERAALAAQVEALITAEPEWARLGALLGEKQVNAFKLQREQHLAEIRAEAGRAGFVGGLRLRSKGPCLDFEAAANQYADSIRQEK